MFGYQHDMVEYVCVVPTCMLNNRLDWGVSAGRVGR